MTAIIVSSSMVTKHRNGGEPWVRLNWILGLQRLGFDVYFLEQIEPGQCVDAAGAASDFDSSDNLANFQAITERYGLQGRTALFTPSGSHTWGLSWTELCDLASSVDALINITGHLAVSDLRRRIRRAIYIDEDPGFTQYWLAAGNAPHLAGHDVYYTVGENIGTPACSVPTSGIDWKPLRQPVVLDLWPFCREGQADRFTTIGSWRGPYGALEIDGRQLGLKVHEFRKFMAVPQRAPGTFEIALDIHPADQRDLDALHEHGWQTVNPKVVAGEPESFQRYVQTSGAEFSVAQGMYVATNSGWFSDRTVRYLASGKPVLVQDTGLSGNYPVGEGLLSFRTIEEAVRGAKSIMTQYQSHCQAARALAERYFNSDTVLDRVMEEIAVRV